MYYHIHFDFDVHSLSFSHVRIVLFAYRRDVRLKAMLSWFSSLSCCPHVSSRPSSLVLRLSPSLRGLGLSHGLSHATFSSRVVCRALARRLGSASAPSIRPYFRQLSVLGAMLVTLNRDARPAIPHNGSPPPPPQHVHKQSDNQLLLLA